MRKMLLVLVLPFTMSLCGDSAVPIKKDPPKPTVAADTVEAVVRVDMGGRYRGPGVTVTSTGYVVTALSNLSEYEFWKYRVTVGSDRIPGKIVAVDETRGLALIRAERPLQKWVIFSSRADFETGEAAVVVSYADSGNDPPMIERRQVPEFLTGIHERGESAGKIDLRDMMSVSAGNGAEKLHVNGAAAFTPNPDRFIGIVIGWAASGYGSNIAAPLMVVPESSVVAFMKAHHAIPKTQ